MYNIINMNNLIYFGADMSGFNNLSLDRLPEILLYGFLGFVISMLATPIYTHFAYKNQWWKKQHTKAITGEKAAVFHKLHAEKHKRNIPTMAGLVMVFAVIIVTLLFNLSRSQTWLPLAAFAAAAFIGLIDDVVALKGGNRGLAGLKSGKKLFLSLIVGLVGGLYFYSKLNYASVHLPYGGDLNIGWLMVPLFVLIVISSANAVNITDGLDGLAGGLCISAFGAYTIISFLQQRYGLAGFCATIVGTLLSYVWFNIYPARFFMTDIGSQALGVTLGVIAMLTDTVFILPIIALVFVLDAGSSVIQILSKKIRGKKIFLSAPIHHHFEAIGWEETKVTMRFWVIGQMSATLGLIIALMGGFIKK